ncbi:MAG TPA: cbb3-type cytochrome c oxidase subunit II [Ottowia sp.]|uniref:cbb3-type cytochrome c oxidase subunit II n=1 Tax=Ottowia sp. TaxID=1898956 RepID=UPI002C416A58|nr:cbb3-type cytochrome c oxidase subunit II [Ottowia sp.]HMN20043.1 cbb3-type cytochrome c oxidase subunit II [Ottowia sp.]
MENEVKLTTGAMVTFAIAVSALVILPYIQVRGVEPPDGLRPYTSAELRGRASYIANGCMYCHSQQPRSESFAAADAKRGWGRPSVPGDYYYDKPHLLGSMRTGPDLFNIGVRQPSKDWQLGHLYQPRAYVPGSIMPSYPYLFEVKDKADPDEEKVNLPPGIAPEGRVVVARPEALDLVRYLQSLKREYPILPPEPREAEGAKTSAAPQAARPAAAS